MRLTHDEIETIRIHINAFKENVCNQHRWKEAEEYQTIVDKLDDLLTVDAIPVEWLEESTREREGTDYENFIIEVLNEWAEQRKEE